jgi:serine/threonine-protein kinase
MLQPGARFDRYTIEALLGEGGMGCVYLAFDERLHRRVALKVMRHASGDASDPAATDAVARLFREARAVAALTHPNIVVVHDVGEVDGVPFLAMEHVTGRTLRAHMAEDVPLPTRLRWLGEVARALAAAHRAGLVHRDVKPENVLVSDEGAVKVLDFGIARSADAGSGLQELHQALETITVEGALLGTPQYMAPEQLENKPVDGRTDQFSWGVVAYEVLAQKRPWTGTTWPELVMAMSQEPPSLGAAVAAEVEAVVLRTLRKRPEERFPSMNEVVSALERAAGPSQPPPSSRPEWMVAIDAAMETPPAPRPSRPAARLALMATGPPPPAGPYLPTPVEEAIFIQRRDLCVIVNHGPPTVEQQRSARRQTLELGLRYPAGLGCLVIIDAQSPAPDAEVRREIDQVLADLSPCLRALAWVVLGDGFQAAAVRAVLTGLPLGRPRSYPTKIASDLRSALAWALPLLEGGAARLGELDEHVAALQLDAHVAAIHAAL